MFRILLLLGLLAFPALARDVAPLRDYLRGLEQLGFAGAVLVADGDKVLLHEGYGLADREAQRRWDRSTVSTIGSITKQFTGAAILALQEDGRLRVEDPITKYFPDVPQDKTSITLHMLLTHSSGIVDLEGMGDFDPIGREEFVRRSLAQELAFEPGTSYEYSNAGYSLLGAIVEQLSGQSYEQFLRARFFEPLGMKDSGYILPQWDPARFAQGYRDGERWGVVVQHAMAEDGPYWVLRANGGMHCTLTDLWKWLRALDQGKVLSRASMDLYWHPHVDEGGGESFYGYGWVVAEMGDVRLITHNGGNGIHFADVGYAPDEDLFVALQTNVLSEFSVANQLLGRIAQFLFMEGEAPRVPGFEAREPAELAAMAGRYEFAGGGTVQLSADGKALELVALDPQAFHALLSLRPLDPARAARCDRTIDQIVEAFLQNDWAPLAKAYGDRVSEAELRERGATQRAEWESEHGALRGHRVLGTALRDGRDETVVRIEFERGNVEFTYVFDAGPEQRLLGRSRRGLDTVMRVYPDRDGAFLSWDPDSGATRPLRVERGSLRFLDQEQVAQRVGD